MMSRAIYHGKPIMSPNREKLAFAVGDSTRSDIWLYDLGRGTCRLGWRSKDETSIRFGLRTAKGSST